jgi:hypothetical protein
MNNDKLRISVYLYSIKWAADRAGNPKSISLSETAPSSIDSLACVELGTGHDCFLKGVVVLIDWKINKIIREQLLRYNFINVVSSQSLMHCFDKFKRGGIIDSSIKSVDDLPLSFEYWISFHTNYLQLKTIYKQRKNHKRKEWQNFCEALETLPHSNWITGVEQ